MHNFYEFFAGGGMARLGLGPKWKCLFANDIDPKKAAAYRANFGGAPELKLADVASLTTEDLPGWPDLVWASFPCQDLSLAGAGAGLNGERSGAFWPFWRLMLQLIKDRRKPPMIALENVCGALTSHGGRDFAAIGQAMSSAGYKFGAVVIDAVHFVPQSRPRLFIVGVDHDLPVPTRITSQLPLQHLHPTALIYAKEKLSSEAGADWVWWKLPKPKPRTTRFIDLIEKNPPGASWASLEETNALLALMSPVNMQKVIKAQLERRRIVGGVYRRTRFDEAGKKVQRAEVRFDDLSGCLRTPGGGSSRQRVLIVEGSGICMRLLSAREAARLMGLPENYRLPERYNEAYHLVGDGVAVPVVRWLSQHLLVPLASACATVRIAAE